MPDALTTIDRVIAAVDARMDLLLSRPELAQGDRLRPALTRAIDTMLIVKNDLRSLRETWPRLARTDPDRAEALLQGTMAGCRGLLSRMSVVDSITPTCHNGAPAEERAPERAEAEMHAADERASSANDPNTIESGDR